MSEQHRTISEARQNLSSLSDAAAQQMTRTLITNQGKPQSVLIGYDDFRGLQAAAELLSRPHEMEKIREGLRQTEEERLLTPAGLKERVRLMRESTAKPGSLKWPGAMSADPFELGVAAIGHDAGENAGEEIGIDIAEQPKILMR